MNDDVEQIVWKHCLFNACKHDGKAEFKSVIGRVISERPDLKNQFQHIKNQIEMVLKQVNDLKSDDQIIMLKNKFPDSYSNLVAPSVSVKKLPDLPNVTKGSFVVRLPPEPSGYMHIGHAMSGLINFFYAKEYDGKIWLRFEDTNPKTLWPDSNESNKEIYYDSFRSGYKLLGIHHDEERIVSDDLPKIYEYGEIMIKQNHAYVCQCSSDLIKANRHQGIACSCKNNDNNSNVELWNKMHAREFKEGEAVVRLNSDMNSTDPSLRDPNLFRLIDYPHPRQENNFNVWPVYDFAVVIEDYLCGISHVLRSLEFHETLQNRIRTLLDFPSLTTVQFSRFNFIGTPVAKRVLRPLLEQGKIASWDDPRMPTIAGLTKKGICAESIVEFTKEIGYTKSEHTFDWDVLNATNRKILDPSVPRYFFVPNPIRLEVENAPEIEVEINHHPEKNLGTRKIKTNGVFFISSNDLENMVVGDKFRLMEAYNVKLTKLNEIAHGIYDGPDIIKGMNKIQWVTADHVPFTVRNIGPLFINDSFNDESLIDVEGFAENACKSLSLNQLFQFIRVGFCKTDQERNNLAIRTHK
jgi:glutamyl-tRNA synthetase